MLYCAARCCHESCGVQPCSSSSSRERRQPHARALRRPLNTADPSPATRLLPALSLILGPGAAAAEQLQAAAGTSGYVPSPYEPGWEVWFGAIAGALPFVIASWEFGKRIVIQRRCPECRGSGLVPSPSGRALRKCPQCGGFLPWLGWKYFFLSTAAPGNGGPLLQPRGQRSVFYRVPPPPSAAERQAGGGATAEQQGAAVGEEARRDGAEP